MTVFPICIISFADSLRRYSSARMAQGKLKLLSAYFTIGYRCKITETLFPNFQRLIKLPSRYRVDKRSSDLQFQ